MSTSAGFSRDEVAAINELRAIVKAATVAEEEGDELAFNTACEAEEKWYSNPFNVEVHSAWANAMCQAIKSA